MSEIEVGEFLTWKTHRPTEDHRSSSKFRLQNSKWYLLLCEHSSEEFTGFGQHLRLHLFQEPSVATPVLPFEVSCFAKTSKGTDGFALTCKTYKPNPVNDLAPICIIKGMYKVLPFAKITFVVIFQDKDGTALNVIKETDEEPIPVVTSDLDSLSADLGSLLESGQVSDVQLKTNGRIRSAHRSVLAARSEVFSAMFRSDMKESICGQVDISDVDGEVMDLFLQYVYTGTIPDSLGDSNSLAELYAVGDKYAVRTLKKLCRDLLTRQVSEDNYQELLALADEHSDVELKDKVIEYVVENPNWLNVEKWFEFSKKHLAVANDVYRKFCDKKYFSKA